MTKLQTIIEFAIEKGLNLAPEGCLNEIESVGKSDVMCKIDQEYYKKINKGKDFDEIEIPPTSEGYAVDKNLLYSHDFLKAVFGEKPLNYDGEMDWHYHAQQMVISEDPINYIWEYINELD